jgi:hypothetical protein
MMKKYLVLFFIFFATAFRSGDYKLLNTVVGPASFMTSDNLGNLYLIVNNELRKYDENGTLLKTFSDKSRGMLSFADVSDPLKILLYYHDFRQLLFLDNMLSVKGDALLLDDLGILQPMLACTSYDNGFWVYDQQDFQLLRFDKNLNASNQSGNIVQLTGLKIKPNFLTEVSDKVYMNDPEHGILVFDKYGTYARTLPIKNLSSFQVREESILYSDSSKMIRYNLKTFEQQSMQLPQKNAAGVRIEKERLYIKDSTSVKIYSDN